MSRAVYRAPDFEEQLRRSTPAPRQGRAPAVEHRRISARPQVEPRTPQKPPPPKNAVPQAAAPQAAAPKPPPAKQEKKLIKDRVESVREQVMATVRSFAASVGALDKVDQFFAERDLSEPFATRPPKPNKRVRLTCYLLPEDYALVNAQARASGRDHANVVGDLIRKALEPNEPNV